MRILDDAALDAPLVCTSVRTRPFCWPSTADVAGFVVANVDPAGSASTT